MPEESLHRLLEQVRTRKRLIAGARLAGAGMVGLLVFFSGLVALAMAAAQDSVWRIVIFTGLVLGAGAIAGLLVRLYQRQRSDDRRLAHYVEERFPDLEQRLLTSIELEGKDRTGISERLVERLWEDARTRVKELDVRRTAPAQSVLPPLLAAGAVAAVFILFAWYSPDFSRTSRELLWPWRGGAMRLPELTVEPGDRRVRRGEDLNVIATLDRSVAGDVALFIQTDRLNWDRRVMDRESGNRIFTYYLPALVEDAEYYIEAGNVRSRRYRLTVFDLPQVEQVDAAYQYPAYTGLEARTETNSGDITAPVGTVVQLTAISSKPLRQAVLRFGDGAEIALNVQDKTVSGAFTVSADSSYSIRLMDIDGLENDYPAEYFVRAIADTPPELAIAKPGRDRRVTPLEEVELETSAKDDYGITDFRLHYAVAGREEQEVRFLKKPAKGPDAAADGNIMLYMEELNLTPGDFVTYYLSARDNNGIDGPAEKISDMYFLEVVSTEDEFYKAQNQEGGGGEGGQQRGNSSALTENQKQIIAATWKLIREQAKMTPEQFREDLQVIAESQRDVMERATMSLQRLAERLTLSDKSYDNAVVSLKAAVDAMRKAMEQLYAEHPKEALPPEQAALMAILKAESEGRRNEISLARQQGSRGGGGQQREREDLSRLFEMEMGRLENRYEMPKGGGGGAEQQEEENDTLARLKELAQRQEQLNRDQQAFERRHNQLTDEQQKRQLDQLRREQEELSRDMRDLSDQMSRLARGQQQPGAGGGQQRMDQIADEMEQAAESLLKQKTDMAAAKSQKALDMMRDQAEQLNRQQSENLSQKMEALNQKADALASREQQIQQDIDGLQQEGSTLAPRADDETIKILMAILDSKEQMKQELQETKQLLDEIRQSRSGDQQETAEQADNTLQSLNSERLEDRIDDSQRILKEGWLSLSREMERRIQQSLDRVGQRIRSLGQETPQSREEQLRHAAENAGRLRREMENLQRQAQQMAEGAQQPSGQQQDRQNGQQQQGQQQGRQQGQESQGQQQGQQGDPNSRQPGQQPGQQQNNQQGGQGGRQRMQESLERSRQYAQGLMQPWARGERWSDGARSVHRDITQNDVEDFLQQPELWSQLMKQLRELEATLQAQSELNTLQKKLFSAREDEVPEAYRKLVEEYYRALSEESGNQEQ